MGWTNYPDGVSGSDAYFNPPPEPECPDCFAAIDWEWLYCPWCGARLRPDEWDDDCYIGPQAYDSGKDYDIDRALDGQRGLD